MHNNAVWPLQTLLNCHWNNHCSSSNWACPILRCLSFVCNIKMVLKIATNCSILLHMLITDQCTIAILMYYLYTTRMVHWYVWIKLRISDCFIMLQGSGLTTRDCFCLFCTQLTKKSMQVQWSSPPVRVVGKCGYARTRTRTRTRTQAILKCTFAFI